jgi:hypothetical protein
MNHRGGQGLFAMPGDRGFFIPIADRKRYQIKMRNDIQCRVGLCTARNRPVGATRDTALSTGASISEKDFFAI